MCGLSIQRCAQIIFMELLGGIFKVTGQNWKEWLAAIAIGAGSMVVAFLTKAVTRCAKDRCLQGLIIQCSDCGCRCIICAVHQRREVLLRCKPETLQGTLCSASQVYQGEAAGQHIERSCAGIVILLAAWKKINS